MVEYWSPTPKLRGSIPLSPVNYFLLDEKHITFYSLIVLLLSMG